MNKGLVQNITIFLLILMSLILLSIRFELFITTGVSSGSIADTSVSLPYSVRPNSIVLRSGAENAIKLIDTNGVYYLEVAKVLEGSLRSRTALEDVSKEEYRKKKEEKSIQLNFEPAINQRLLYGSLFLEDGYFGDFGKIRQILVPQNYDTSIYFETEDERTIEVKNPTINAVSSFENFGSLSHRKYYSISERFPEITDNDVLISDEARLSSFVTESMFNEENIDAALRAVLGSRYDFANKISEIDGSTIVTYDYGREIIKISPQGKVFYYNKDAELNTKRTTATEAVALAMSLVNAISQEQASYVVEDIESYKEGNKTGFALKISRRMDGIRVSLKNDVPAISVVVINGKVYSMEGIFRTTRVEVDNNLAFGENAVLLMLEQNYDHIQGREPFNTTSELFDMIQSVEYAYVYSHDYNMIACYRMVIGETTFFFKIENAEMMT